MKQKLHVSIEPMMEEDVAPAIELISAAMNENEAKWARQAMHFYFACKKHGLDSGRDYFVWRHQKKVQGLIGLHRYIWGPRENVWLSWFAVHPAHQGKKIGAGMIDAIEKIAKQSGYKKFLIETYDNPTFERARALYRSKGFTRTGHIENYLPDGSAMLVFTKHIVR